VIGAVFGQTEGLFEDTLDIKKLQKAGRVGRIDVEVKEEGGRTAGLVSVPSSLDQATTSLLAAALESIEKVGPYNSKFSLVAIEDFREKKRKEIVERAQDIAQRWKAERMTADAQAITGVVASAEVKKPVNWGPDNLPAGPEVESSDELVIVEGRADVSLLLTVGVKNAVGTNGVNVPNSVAELAKRKKRVTAFLDGDRVGEMILRELLRMGVKVDSVARAPPGKEVEELTPAEALDTLKKPVPLQEYLVVLNSQRKAEIPPEQIKMLKEASARVKEKLISVLLDDEGDTIAEIPVGELFDSLEKHKGAHALVFDGVVTQRLVDRAEAIGVKMLVGERIGKIEKQPSAMMVFRIGDLLSSEQGQA
jgi:DNA primase